MTEQELKFVKYFNKINIDAMIFEQDFIKELDDCDVKELSSDINLDCISDLLEEISYGHYPKFATDNLGILIKYLNKNSEKNKEKIEEMLKHYEEIKNIETDNKIYLYEAFYKVIDSQYLKALDYINVDEESIIASIRFDSVTINTLINKNIEVLDTIFYVFSIKKFLLELPELFLDKDINKRAIEILEKNIKHDGASRLIYKLKHIEKFIENNFSMVYYKTLYDYIVLQNMLNNNIILRRNTEYISEDIMENLYYLIDENLIKDEKNKKAAYEIMNAYKDNKYDNLTTEQKREFLKKHNEYIGKLNSMTEYSNIIITSEYATRLDGINKGRVMIKPLDLDTLINKDLQLINLYMFDEKQYEEESKNIDHNDLYLCVNKFTKLAPSIFDDDIIYRRTMELLDSKNIPTKKVREKVKRIYQGR